MAKAINNVKRLYTAKGFTILQVNADNEFAPLVLEVLELTFNLTSKDEHVPTIERRIRVLKERFRAIRHTLLYRAITRLMIVELAARNGIPNISPCTLVTRRDMDYSKILSSSIWYICTNARRQSPYQLPGTENSWWNHLGPG